MTHWARLSVSVAAYLVGMQGVGSAYCDELDLSARLDAAIATITPEELRQHASLLADDTLEGRAAGTRGGRAAARYVEQKLAASSLQPAGDGGGYLQRFDAGYQNLLAVLPGADPELKSQFVLVGAHYDHVGYGTRRNSNGPVGYIHNGADDNASGVAALLELVDALTRTHWQPRRSILVAFWDGEEINLLGSRHWLRQPTVPANAVRVAVNVDMVGRMRQGRLEVGGTRTAAGLRQLMSSKALPTGTWLDFSWEFKENSDHWPFFMANVPSLILHTGVHAEYHTPHDDIERLNLPGLRAASAYLLGVVCRLADASELPAFRSSSRTEHPSMQRARHAPLPPASPRLGVTWDWIDNAEAPVLRVASIVPGSAAETAGLQTGDQVAAIDGVLVEHEHSLAAAVLRAERDVTLSIVRNAGEPRDVVVRLDGSPARLGLSWREDDAEPHAVFVTRVIPYSPAARAEIHVHDRIYSLNGEPFADADDLLSQINELVAEDAPSLVFEIERSGRIQMIEVDMQPPGREANDASL